MTPCLNTRQYRFMERHSIIPTSPNWICLFQYSQACPNVTCLLWYGATITTHDRAKISYPLFEYSKHTTKATRGLENHNAVVTVSSRDPPHNKHTSQTSKTNQSKKASIKINIFHIPVGEKTTFSWGGRLNVQHFLVGLEMKYL